MKIMVYKNNNKQKTLAKFFVLIHLIKIFKSQDENKLAIFLRRTYHIPSNENQSDVKLIIATYGMNHCFKTLKEILKPGPCLNYF